MSDSKKNNHTILHGFLIGILVALVVFILNEYLLQGFFKRYELSFYDLKMQKASQFKLNDDGSFNGTNDIIIVDIDARSTYKLGKFYSWPRTYWARLIKYLGECNVKAVGMDLLFDPDKRHPIEENEFLESIKKANNVYSSIILEKSSSQEQFLESMKDLPSGFPKNLTIINPEMEGIFPASDRIEPNFPQLAKFSKGVGHVISFPGRDGVVRSIYPFLQFNNYLFPSFSLKIAADSLKIAKYSIRENSLLLMDNEDNLIRKIHLTERAQLPVYFNGTFKTFRYISFFDVMNKRVDPGYLKNKIVLIGTSLPGLYDLRSIPLQEAFPGVEMHANIIYNILNNVQINQLGTLGVFILILSIGVLFSLLIIYLRPVKALITLFAILLVYFIISITIFINNLFVIPDFVVIVNLFIILLVNYSYRYFTEEKNKKQIKNMFSHYVSKSVVDEILKNPNTLKLGGEKKNCTVLFSDIEGFTTISENLSPEKLVHLINEYHSEMTEMVFENNGFLDKYEGDAIMAVYGAPISYEDHALSACKSALEMQYRLKALEKKWEREKRPILKCRIGINSGEMIVGNMGSATRFDYTVMGDEVNLGARLESANKAFGSKIMIGHNTYLEAKHGIIARKLDLLLVKGKNKPVPVYELLATVDNGNPTLYKKVEFFEKGFEEYLNKNWLKALQYFEALIKLDGADLPAKVFTSRCKEYLNNPPAQTWNGVFTMKTK